MVRRIFASQQTGLILVILLLGAILTGFAGSHVDRLMGHTFNNFLNSYTLLQTATDASFFAVMAVGATLVIISGGIDLSVVTMAMALRSWDGSVWTGLAISLGIGLVCGLVNGLMIASLRVHPFIITLGTMWVFRGIAFLSSKAESYPRAGGVDGCHQGPTRG